MGTIKSLIALLLLFSSPLFSQNNFYYNNFAVNIGYAKSLIIDGSISPNEYSGNSTFYGISWGDCNEKRLVQFDVSLNKIKELKNNLSRAENSNFHLAYRHLFFISNYSIASNPFNFYLGPGISVFFYDRLQIYVPMSSQFGVGGIDLNSRGTLLLSDRVAVTSQLLLSIISFANNSQNYSNSSEKSTFKILSPFSLLNMEFNLMCRYSIWNLFYLEGIYSFNYCRTSNWNYFRVIGDKISIQLGISF